MESVREKILETFNQNKNLNLERKTHEDIVENLLQYHEELDRLDQRRHLPLAIIMADVNGLKLMNDTFGHALGDQLLRAAGTFIKEHFREDEVVARYGGDEFAVILNKVDKSTVEKILKRLQSQERVLKVNGILSTLHEKHPREEQHVKRVREHIIGFTSFLDYDHSQRITYESAGLVHDIGKMAIDYALLELPRRLTAFEYDIIKKHVDVGYRVLKSCCPIPNSIPSWPNNLSVI